VVTKPPKKFYRNPINARERDNKPEKVSGEESGLNEGGKTPVVFVAEIVSPHEKVFLSGGSGSEEKNLLTA